MARFSLWTSSGIMSGPLLYIGFAKLLSNPGVDVMMGIVEGVAR